MRSYVRAIHEDIKMPVGQLLYAGLQVHDGLFDCDIEGEDGDPGVRKVVL